MSDINYNQFISVDLVIDHIDDGVFSVNQPSAYASEGDLNGRTSNVQITERGKVGAISGLSINAVWTNFATVVTDITALELIDKDTSVYRFTYPSHMMTAGKVEVKFQLIYNGKVSLTRPFIITVLATKGNFSALIESQQFSALTQALNKNAGYDSRLTNLENNSATKIYVDAVLASIADGSPKELFYSLDALKAKYPTGQNGIFLVFDSAFTDGAHAFIWSNSAWKDLGKYQATNVSDNDVNKIVAKTRDFDNWYQNSPLYSTLPNAINTVGAITKQIIARNGRNWASFASTGGSGDTYAYVDINLNSDIFYYGGTYEFDIYQTSGAVGRFELFANVYDNSNVITKLSFGIFNVLNNFLSKIKGDFFSLSANGFSFSNTTKVQFGIRPVSQTAFSFMIKDLKFATKTASLIDTTDNAYTLATINKSYVDEWYQNSILSPYEANPFTSYGTLTVGIIRMRNAYWYNMQGLASESGSRYVQVNLEVKKNPDRFYNGGDGEIIMYSPELDSEFEIFSYVFDMSGTMIRRLPLKMVKLQKNKTTIVKFDYPSLYDLGFAYDAVGYATLCIKSSTKEAFNLSVKNLHFLTKAAQKIESKREENWISNSRLDADKPQPFSVNAARSELVKDTYYNWGKLIRDDGITDKAYFKFPLDITRPERYYYGGIGSLILRETIKPFQTVAISLYLTLTNSTVVEIPIEKTEITLNESVEIKFVVPALVRLGYALADLSNVSLIITPEKQDVIGLQVADVNITTKMPKITDYSIRTNYDGVTSQLPRLDFKGDFDALNATNSITTNFKYTEKDRVVEGYSETKWQGNSSLNLPKKNFRLRSFSADTLTKENKLKFSPSAKIAPQDKFNIKANYIDRYQARNIICADLAFEMYSERCHNDAIFDNLPHGGQIQGFPVTLWFNNLYYGLATFNTAKTDELFGVSDESKHIAIGGNNNSSGNRFGQDTATVSVDDASADFELMFPDEVTDYQQTAINTLAAFINSSTDVDFKANLEQHYSLETAIDWLLLLDATCNLDMYGKNIIHITYDGLKWFALPYDMDNTYGVHWTGNKENDIEVNFLSKTITWNKLLSRIIVNFPERIVARYDELVSKGILTAVNMQRKFDAFIDSVGQANYEMDKVKWSDPNYTSNPAYDILDYDRTSYIIRHRFKLLKEHIDALR